jgi:hypothetical protein
MAILIEGALGVDAMAADLTSLAQSGQISGSYAFVVTGSQDNFGHS